MVLSYILYLLAKRLRPEDIIYWATLSVHSTFWGYTQLCVYLNFDYFMVTCQGYSHLSHAHLTTHYGEIVMRKYKSK